MKSRCHLVGALIAFAGSSTQAQLAPRQQSTPPTAADNRASESAEAELAGDHDKALRLADDAIKSDPKNPWAYYNRGDALGALHRPDEAIAALENAEQRFSAAELWGKSIASWGKANVSYQLGRCQNAAPIFERYASLVEQVDKGAADVARQAAKHCTPAPNTR
jgi:tetratricopeptide (TPR) repeat protein